MGITELAFAILLGTTLPDTTLAMVDPREVDRLAFLED